MLVCSAYITWLKQLKSWAVPTVVVSVVVVSVHHFTSCVILEATQMNVQCSLIQKLVLYKFELGHNAAEATKKICHVKGESTVDHSTVTRWLKKLCLDGKNFNQARTGRSKTRGLVTFTTLAKPSRFAELCNMLLKYCKTFVSPHFFF